MSHHVLALGSKDLKRFVEDQSQLWENRAASNPTTMVMGYLGLRNTHPVHFPVDIVPAERFSPIMVRQIGSAFFMFYRALFMVG
jgi:hypothetical protein